MTIREDPPTTPPCPSCGGALVASDVPRKRYRCVDCGLYCDGTASESLRLAAKKAADEAERMVAQAALARRREQEA